MEDTKRRRTARRKQDYSKPLKLPYQKEEKDPTSPSPEIDMDPEEASRERLRNAKLLLQHSSDSRKRYDYEWMTRNLFWRGYHFSKYQPTTNTIILSSRQTAKIPINIMAMQMRSICNQVTSFRPKWEVMPRGSNEGSRTVARYSQVLLDYIFDTERLKTKIKETVKQGLLYSVGGPWQIVYNEETDRVEIWSMDTFDFYWDMFADEFQDCQYMIKAIRKPIDYVRKNPDFDKKARMEIHGGEERMAVSENKQFLVQSMRLIPAMKEKEYESLILFEGYFKEIGEDGKATIRKVVWTDQNTTPLIDEVADDPDEFDFVLYRADLNPREILGESWSKHVMPINRVIDSLESSVFDYATKMAKGRILVDKDSGVDVIHTVHGEIIHKNRGSDVKNLDMPNLPHSVNLLIDRMNKYAEDLGGVHDHTLGRNASGARSGLQIAELKQSDSTSQDDLVDNLEDFLEEVAQKVLRKIARHYKSYHIVQALGYKESEAKAFAVIGSKAKGKDKKDKAAVPGHENQVKIGPDWLDIAEIGEDNMVRVNVGSWLGYTKEAAQEKALELAKAGIISQQEVLSVYEFGDINGVIQRTRSEKVLNKFLNSQPQPGQQDDYNLALTENEMMVNENKDMPVSDVDDHLVHIAIHQEALGQGADDLVLKHIQIHNVKLGMEGEGGHDAKATQQQQQPMQQPMPQGAPPQMQPQQAPPMAPPQQPMGGPAMPGMPQ